MSLASLSTLCLSFPSIRPRVSLGSPARRCPVCPAPLPPRQPGWAAASPPAVPAGSAGSAGPGASAPAVRKPRASHPNRSWCRHPPAVTGSAELRAAVAGAEAGPGPPWGTVLETAGPGTPTLLRGVERRFLERSSGGGLGPAAETGVSGTESSISGDPSEGLGPRGGLPDKTQDAGVTFHVGPSPRHAQLVACVSDIQWSRASWVCRCGRGSQRGC